jgi:hypothetical protein
MVISICGSYVVRSYNSDKEQVKWPWPARAVTAEYQVQLQVTSFRGERS